jgi:hypothetical protein
VAVAVAVAAVNTVELELADIIRPVNVGPPFLFC